MVISRNMLIPRITLATCLAITAIGTPAPASARDVGDPLDTQLWGLTMVEAEAARRINAGDKNITVGVIDTGIDASHPDIAPNFRRDLSRTFAHDIPEIDGACESISCLDDPGTDDGGHGTHVAGTVAAALNGLGVSGIAPNVGLVNLKAGQDSGFFFLEPVVEALRYAADAGIDIVNMSFYVDPWLYNCRNNSADTAEQRAEQQKVIDSMTEALKYAHSKGVTLIAALGNEATDLGVPGTDESSPNYPFGTNHSRQIDNKDCVSLPAEGTHVVGVSALGPSRSKAAFSNYGTEQADLSAPGGWSRDGVGSGETGKPQNMILSTYPLHVLQKEGLVDTAGNVTDTAGLVERSCLDSVCGYYKYLNGTSMASPHAAGVAALVASAIGTPDPMHVGEFAADPEEITQILLASATNHSCPIPATVEYSARSGPAQCVGDDSFNGFYGHGIVNARAALELAHRPM